MWAFPFFQIHVLGLMSRAFVWAAMEGHGQGTDPHCSFGLAIGILGPVLYPHQLPPSPCVRTAWARAMINPATVVISTCLLGCGLIKPDRRHTWCVNDDPLGFALVFHACFSYSPCFPLFLADLPSFEFFWPYTFPLFFFLFLGVLVFHFLLDFHLSIWCWVLFWRFSSSISFPGLLRLRPVVFLSIGTTRL